MTDRSESPTAADVLSVLRSSHALVVAILNGLSDEQAAGPSYADEWSIAHVASHLGSGAEVFTLFLDAGLTRAPAPGVEQFEPIWAERNAKPPAGQVRDFVASDATFVDRVGSLTDAQQQDWRLDLFGSEQTLAGLLRMRLAEHALHSWDIAVALEPTATLSADAAELVIDNLAFLVERTSKPSPATISVGVHTTVPERLFRLDLTPEGATLAPERSDTAEAELRLPAEAFVRLVYGRLDSGHTPASVTARGVDLDLLRQVFPGV
jgi:uncharacterized protein (TIGR03083 family)